MDPSGFQCITINQDFQTRDVYPLSKIKDLFAFLAGGKLFSVMQVEVLFKTVSGHHIN